MIVTLVHVYVRAQHVDEFIAVTRKNHEASIQENGNFRFDVLQDAADPMKFILYEAYVSAEAAAAHKGTPHYVAWRDTVAAWMAKPREGQQHVMLFPEKQS
jgi:(4S)-4-hydroxy-5-phosphonooxypentane-2,3-dione isomerase